MDRNKPLKRLIFLLLALYASSSLYKVCFPSRPAGSKVGPAIASSSSSPANQPRKAVPQSVFKLLAVSQVEVVDDKVRVSGKTDLPNGSVVKVSFTIPDAPSNETFAGSNADASVSEHTFSATLAFPQRPEFVKGPYLVELLFTPKAQSSSVVEKVGVNGESLSKGKLHSDFKVWRVERRLESLKMKPLNLPSIPSESEFEVDSPQRAFVQVVYAWSKKDWATMIALAHDSWQETQTDPRHFVESTCTMDIPFGLTDISMEAPEGSDVPEKPIASTEGQGISDSIFVVATLHTKRWSAGQKVKIRCHMIRENGKWGWNPSGALDRTEI